MKEKHNVKYRSFRSYIVGAFLILISLLVILTTVVSIEKVYSELQMNAMDYTEQVVLQINAEIDMYVEHIKDISDFVAKNSLIDTYLHAAKDRELTSELIGYAQNQLEIAGNIRGEITTIALAAAGRNILFGIQGQKLNTFSAYKVSSWYKAALQNPDEVQISSSRVENLVEGEYSWVVSFSKAICAKDGSVLGVLLIDLNYKNIDKLCAQVDLGNRGYIYLIDQNGEILWHPRQNLIYAGLKGENTAQILQVGSGQILSRQGSNRIISIACPSTATGWTAVGIAYPNELFAHQKELYLTLMLIALIGIVVAFAFAIWLSGRITNPIRELTKTMRCMEEGNLNVRCDVTENNELGMLSDSFNHMIATTKNLMDEQVRIEAQKRKSEWRALQAQIKPHFLYNTLDSIIWMSHAGRNAEVVEMTCALAALLRNSIGSGNDCNTLETELIYLKNYLIIQKMRYNEKLSYDIDMDPQTKDCLLPKLILQPLVENAIYHGIKVKETGGTVHIETMLDENKLLITIEDDGVGMSQKQIQTIFDNKESDEESTKIGVCNVYERLQYFFGDEAEMKYYSAGGKGTMVMLVLPIMKEEKETEQ